MYRESFFPIDVLLMWSQELNMGFFSNYVSKMNILTKKYQLLRCVVEVGVVVLLCRINSRDLTFGWIRNNVSPCEVIIMMCECVCLCVHVHSSECPDQGGRQTSDSAGTWRSQNWG